MTHSLTFKTRRNHLFPGETFRWVDVREYSVQSPALSENEILGQLLRQPNFSDAYLSSEIGRPAPEGIISHGPYYLASIQIEDFEIISERQAANILDHFIGSGLDPHTRHDTGTEYLFDLLHQAEHIYRLREKPESRHAMAWILHEFEELLVVERSGALYDVVVGTD